jgi:hypothetical protein
MALPTGTAGVFAPVNVAGVLYGKTPVDTPLFNAIRGTKQSQSREFVVSSMYELGAASQPAISETASVTAPTPAYVERDQETNVTQIFQRAVAVTYRKQSNADELTGLNLAGQSNNVPSELSFQIARQLDSIRNDMEYTIINGVYQKATNADEADKTRGLIAAAQIAIDAAGDELTPDLLLAVARALAENSPRGLNGVVGILNAEQLVQLNKIIMAEGLRVSPNTAGSNLLTYYTPFGTLNFIEGGHRFMPNGTALFANLSVCSHVMQPVPGKGNFFYETLAKTGAAETGQIYGQWGLDHGPGIFHAKITGLATSTEPVNGLKVFVTNTTTSPVPTKEVV